MRTYDFSPLFRSSIGFDRLARVVDGLAGEQAPAYPPYNIEQIDENHYRITIAVAGFTKDDLEIVLKDGTLTVRCAAHAQKEKKERKYLYHGIAWRAFERRFQLADHIQITGADLEHGLLNIDLEREVPEEMKPRTIEITSHA